MKARMKDLFFVSCALAVLVIADTALMMAGPVSGSLNGGLSAQTAHQEEEELFLQARRAVNREEFEAAVKLFADLRTRFVPARFLAESYYWEAFARHRLGAMDDALILLETLSVYPEARDRHYDLRRGWVGQGRLYDEVRDLRIRILRQLGEQGDPRAAQAVLHQSEAVLHADTARRLTPASLRARQDSAQRTYQRALASQRTRQDSAQRAFQRALVSQRSRADSAQRAFQRALTRQRSWADSAQRAYQRALAAQRSRADSAQRAYQRALAAQRSRTDSAQRAHQRALAAQRSRADTARRAYQRALSGGRVHPDSAAAEYRAAMEAQKAGQDSAAAEYQRALAVRKAGQDSVAAVYQAAMEAQKAGQDSAAAAYRVALAEKEAGEDLAAATYRTALSAQEAAKDSAVRVYRAALATKEVREDSAAVAYQAVLAAVEETLEAESRAHRAAIVGGTVRSNTVPRVIQPSRMRLDSLQGVLRQLDTAATGAEDLARELSFASQSSSVRAGALAALARGRFVAMQQQVPADCEDTSVQQAALTALLRLETDRMRLVRDVLERREECSRSLRQQAVSWLAALGTEEAEQELIGIAGNHSEPDTRQAAVVALGRFATPGAVQALSGLLVQSDDSAVRQEAVQALRRTSQAGARGALMAFARDASQPVELRTQALVALGQRTDVPTETLMGLHGTDGFQDLETMLLVTVLGRRAQAGEEAVTNWLFERAMDKEQDSDFRQSALEAWSRGPSADLERVGRSYAQLEEREMKERIFYALYRRTQSGQASAPAVVNKMIELARTEADPETRTSAIYWIGRTGSEQAIEFLLEVMREPPKPATEPTIVARYRWPFRVGNSLTTWATESVLYGVTRDSLDVQRVARVRLRPT